MIRARPLRLALLVLLVASCQGAGGGLQSSLPGYRLDDASIPPSAYAKTKWKAFLLAGDNSIAAFDNAVRDLQVVMTRRRSW